MNKATIEFRYSPDYNNDNYDVDVVDRMANVNYEFEVPEHDVTVEDIQYHFNQWLRSLGYIIAYEEE